MRKLLLLLTLILSYGLSQAKSPTFISQGSKVQFENIVKELEKKFAVSVTYDADAYIVISDSEKAEILKEKNIEAALNELTKGKGVKYKKLRSDYYVIVKDQSAKSEDTKASPQAQGDKDRVITGVVYDNKGEALPGATVVAKGNTSIHAITDVNGNFTITVPEGVNVLVVQYLGFNAKEVEITGKTKLNISLEPSAQELKAVIVSGVAGKTTKEKLTITVEHLDAADLKKVPATSASSVLQGKVPGVVVTQTSGQPGVGSSIRLRGATSMLGNNNPLIIVDGIMVQTSLADMNSDDIESMEVVKGAAASALYGSRAAAGVIVINTKRGRGMKDSYEVVVRNEIGNSTLSKYIDLATHHPYQLDSSGTEYPYTRYAGVVYDADGNVVSGSRSLTNSGYADQEYAVLRNHQKDFYKSGNFYTNYLGLANKTKNSNLFFSFENHHNEGIIFNTEGYTRRNLRFNADTRIGKRISLSTSNLYISSYSDKPGSNNSFYDLLFLNPDVDLNQTNTDGSPYKIIPDPWSINENPLYPLHYRQRDTRKSTFMTNVNAKVIIFDWLNLRAKYSYENFNKYYNTYTPKGYLYGGNQNIGGSLYKEQYTANNQVFQTTLNFNKVLGDWLVKGKLSYMYEDENYKDFSVTGRDFIVPNIPQLDNTDPTKSSLNSYDGAIRAIDLFAIADVDYKGKYLFSGLVRRDGSSLFGANERWQSYFRVAGAYRITEDIKIPNVDELKLRAAYGTSGLRPGYSWQYETYYFNNGQLYRDQLGNKNLKPSEARELEIAMDAFFLKKFNFTISYSITNTIGAFAKVPLASHLGYPYQWRNVGDMKSNVLEMSLGYNAIKTKDQNLHFQLNFDKIKQEMVSLTIPSYYTGPHSAYYINPGEPFGIIYGYDWVRSLDQMANQLPAGKTIDDYEVNSDGYVIAKGTQGTKSEAAIPYDADNDGNPDKIAIGDGNPDFHMSLSTTYSFKNFQFYMLLDWKQGGDVYNYTHQYIFRDSRAIEFDQFGKAESEKKSTAYYSNFYQQSINSYFVEDGTFLKLREMSMFYTLKPKMWNGFFKSVKIGLVGRNFLTFTKYSGYDPEVASSGDLTTFAFDDFGYPNFRTFSASLEFRF
jgi:TonB-linked SusC/RagA family outer membrane protein